VFASDRLLGIFRRNRSSADGDGIVLPDSTQRVIQLSDEIAAIHRRIMERSKSGSPEDAADRERLAVLMEELGAKRSAQKRSANTA